MGRKKFNEKDYVGKKFGLLTILKFTSIQRCPTGSQIFRKCLCKCKCGTKREYYFNNIKSGLSQSCGCKEMIGCRDGISGHPFYNTWTMMMKRCYDPKSNGFKNYGKRGIDVYKDWHTVENFTRDVDNILGGKPSDAHSLDRIDNNRGYYPDNIRWATAKEQMNNTRYTYDLTAGNLAKLTGYTRERIRQLTYPNTSSKGKGYPLKDFIDKVIRTEKNTHYIYKPSAIQFLKNRRNNLN